MASDEDTRTLYNLIAAMPYLKYASKRFNFIQSIEWSAVQSLHAINNNNVFFIPQNIGAT